MNEVVDVGINGSRFSRSPSSEFSSGIGASVGDGRILSLRWLISVSSAESSDGSSGISGKLDTRLGIGEVGDNRLVKSEASSIADFIWSNDRFSGIRETGTDPASVIGIPGVVCVEVGTSSDCVEFCEGSGFPVKAGHV